METKCCSKCGETKPLADYYIDRGRVKPHCKACHAAAAQAYRQSHAASLKINKAAYYQSRKTAGTPVVKHPPEKQCITCQEVKPAADFYIDSITGRLIGECKTCRTTAALAYAQAHPKQRRQIGRRYNTQNPDVYRAWRRANPQRVRAIKHRYNSTHPEQLKAWDHRRKARVRGAGGSFTGAEWRALKAQYDHRCLMCGRQEPEIKLSVDHVVPVALGGSNDASNIQPLCLFCNQSKHTTILDLRANPCIEPVKRAIIKANP
jgi:5-methylcytosine-specific restriction endonuclease McrA